MTSESIVLVFNPQSMKDEQILSLNTGRYEDFIIIQNIIRRNIDGIGPRQHILITAPRGGGKSFFLKLLQIRLKQNPRTEVVLFAEEQHNINQPEDFFRCITNAISGKDSSSDMGKWSAGSIEDLDYEIDELKKTFTRKKCSHLVVGLENFDFLLEKGAFSRKEDQIILSDFLSRTPWITIVATSCSQDFEPHYQELLNSFKKHELRPWTLEEHSIYLEKYAKVKGLDISLSLPQLEALSRFSGGLPRVSVIIAEVLLNNRFLSTIETLQATIDKISVFYQDLLGKMPQKTALLFDALIRGGEPCSQVNLAKRVGASQPEINQSFKWLLDNNYLLTERVTGDKSKLYSVRDRIFVQFYRMRYIHNREGLSLLSLLSEFLTSFFTRLELKEKALKLYEKGLTTEALDLMHIVLKSYGVKAEELTWGKDIEKLSKAIKNLAGEFEYQVKFPSPASLEEALKLLEHSYDMLKEYDFFPEDIGKESFLLRLFGSLRLTLDKKALLALACINPDLSKIKWKQIDNYLKEEGIFFEKRIGKRIFAIAQKSLAQRDIVVEFLEESIPRLKDKDNYNLISNFFKAFYRKDTDPETCINLHQELLNLSEDDDIAFKAWNFGRLGLIHEEIGEFKKAVDYYQKVTQFREIEGDTCGQAWSLGRMGWNLEHIGLYEEAKKAHEEASRLYRQAENTSDRAWNIAMIGWNLMKTGDYKEAMAAHEKARKLYKQEKNISGQAWNLGRIGQNKMRLGIHSEAFDAHREAFELYRKENDIAGQAWNLGYMAANMMLKGDENQAWELLDRYKTDLGDMHYKAIKQLSVAIGYHYSKGLPDKALDLGLRILGNLGMRKDVLNTATVLSDFFIGILNEKIGLDNSPDKVGLMLLQSLYEKAIFQFGLDLDLKPISAVIDYIKSGKKENTLLKMAPEKRNFIRTLVNAGVL